MNQVTMTQTLWYENKDGNPWTPPADGALHDPPDGFRYQHSQFPCQLTHTVLDVSDGKSAMLYSGTTTYSGDLVLAMARPSLLEMTRSISRYGWPAQRLHIEAAILLAANLCERCSNAAAHRHGLAWGYRKGSRQWRAANTSCGACR